MAACAQGDSDQAKSSLKAAELPGCARFNEILTVTSSFEPRSHFGGELCHSHTNTSVWEKHYLVCEINIVTQIC